MTPKLDPSSDLSYFPTSILRAILADARISLQEARASHDTQLAERHQAIIAQVRGELQHRSTSRASR